MCKIRSRKEVVEFVLGRTRWDLHGPRVKATLLRYDHVSIFSHTVCHKKTNIWRAVFGIIHDYSSCYSWSTQISWGGQSFWVPGPNSNMYMGGELLIQHQAVLWTPAVSFPSTQLCYYLPGDGIISHRWGLSPTRLPPPPLPSLQTPIPTSFQQLQLKMPSTSLGYYLCFCLTSYSSDVPVTSFSISIKLEEQLTELRERFYFLERRWCC